MILAEIWVGAEELKKELKDSRDILKLKISKIWCSVRLFHVFTKYLLSICHVLDTGYGNTRVWALTR